jgi:hypothetical protein
MPAALLGVGSGACRQVGAAAPSQRKRLPCWSRPATPGTLAGPWLVHPPVPKRSLLPPIQRRDTAHNSETASLTSSIRGESRYQAQQTSIETLGLPLHPCMELGGQHVWMQHPFQVKQLAVSLPGHASLIYLSETKMYSSEHLQASTAAACLKP